MQKSDCDNAVMEIIAFSGESKAFSSKALKSALQNDFAIAEMYLVKSKESLVKANKRSFELITAECKGELKFTLIMAHALDHLSNADISIEQAENLIAVLQKESNDRKEKLC